MQPVEDWWVHSAVEVRPSRIAGEGMFTTGPVPEGTTIVRPGERPVTADLSPADLAHHLNHSCEPTLGWTAGYTLVALRDLAPGEELTVDYATCIADPDFVLFCHCETYRCRQVIEGTDWQIPQLQKRYAGHWSPDVQRLIDANS